MKAVLDWLFRDRTTGRWVIGQFPNTELWLFIGATAVGWFVAADATVGRISWAVATLALGWWASAEMWSGVNPFRRLLGVAVAVLVTVRLINRL